MVRSHTYIWDYKIVECNGLILYVHNRMQWFKFSLTTKIMCIYIHWYNMKIQLFYGSILFIHLWIKDFIYNFSIQFFLSNLVPTSENVFSIYYVRWKFQYFLMVSDISLGLGNIYFYSPHTSKISSLIWVLIPTR